MVERRRYFGCDYSSSEPGLSSSIEAIVREALTPIKITSQAFEESNYTAKRMCDLSNRGLEIYFYLTGTPKEGVRPANTIPIIDGIYIAEEQVVTGVTCDIPTQYCERNFGAIRNANKRLLGWGHSHAFMNTFYSGTDVQEIFELVQLAGFKFNFEKYLSDQLNQTDQPEIIERNEELLKNFNRRKWPRQITWGITFNAYGQKPHCVISYKDKVTGQVPILENVGHTLVDVGPMEINRAEIDNQIIKRVTNFRYDRRLKRRALKVAKKLPKENPVVKDSCPYTFEHTGDIVLKETDDLAGNCFGYISNLKEFLGSMSLEKAFNLSNERTELDQLVNLYGELVKLDFVSSIAQKESHHEFDSIGVLSEMVYGLLNEYKPDILERLDFIKDVTATTPLSEKPVQTLLETSAFYNLVLRTTQDKMDSFTELGKRKRGKKIKMVAPREGERRRRFF